MADKPQYLLVDTKVLPEVFQKVILAKELMATGRAKNASDAAKSAGLSRSAFYKYKDCVHRVDNKTPGSICNFYVSLEDRLGVLSQVINELYSMGASILTINQNIPVDQVAPVSIAIRSDSMVVDEAEMFERLLQIDGVVTAKRIATR